MTYERLIRFIRTYKPDIVMPSFRDVESQHGHHRTITILSEQAFEDAADPSVYPEQLEEGLDVWQIKKLYLPAESEETATTSIEIGDYDPIYGMTYPQLGEESRYLHKSQGMGNDIPAEPRQTHLELVKSSGDSENDDLFSSIPYNLNDWAEIVPKKGLGNQLEKLQQEIETIIELYPNRDEIFPATQNAIKDVQKVLKMTKNTDMDESTKNDLVHKLELKKEQLQQVSFVSSSLNVETTIDSEVLTQGEETQVTMEVTNEGNQKIKNVEASLVTSENWEHEESQNLKHLNPDQSKTVVFNVTVPEDETYYQPYEDSVLQTQVSFKEKGTHTTKMLELDDTIAVLPALSVEADPDKLTINTADLQEEVPVSVNVKNYFNGEKDAEVSLNLPEGWTTDTEQKEVTLTERLEEQEVTFNVSPPSDIEEGDYSFDVIAESDEETYDTTVQEIKYDHINDSYYQYPSTVSTVAFELLKPDNLKVGYIESGFDEVADYLLNVGFDVTKLSEADLESGDLSQYDTIVTGIRANLSRPDLIENNQRLLDYAENGGHVVVQYHKPGDNWDVNETPPYSLELGSPSIEWRVTDEEAPVTMTQPDHKLFNFPNKISESDWDGWVQERGLYFPMNWDNRYETFVSMADPGEDPFDGGILMTDYGEGTYLYSSLVFYRQINNQVPGGYRIFTNLLSYGADENVEEISASKMKRLVERLADDGEFNNEDDVHLLTTHLTSVDHYENKEQGTKVVKHMSSFKQLMNQLLENESVSEKAYSDLDKDADSLIEKWQ
ncbi:FIMAH domain-containing protein [Virgibacillus salidurans]|uniref:FIMAH domain-containing protein n=1 Tax=Virgibacillus salidurans TaxID=2831673 RepID=UPI00351CD2EC